MSISFDLSGRVVLVTGGSKGIGKAIALDFLKAGANVAVCSRSQKALDEVATPTSSLITIAMDATNEADVAMAVERTVERFGKLDILVNNVGGAIKFGHFLELTTEDWVRAFELNVLSMVLFSKNYQYLIDFWGRAG